MSESNVIKAFRRFPGGVQSALYNLAAALMVATNRVIVVEGELDVLALQQVGFGEVVSVPDGTGSKLTPELLAPLADFETVLIAVDHDGAGEELAKNLAMLLGVDRCRRVVFGSYKDANDALIAGKTRTFFEKALADAARMTYTAGADDSADGDWGPPVPLFDFEPPPFPVHVLPGWARSFVEQLAVSTQTPPDLAALMVLGAVALATARKCRVRVRSDYSEPLNIFVAVSLAPGNRKSAVLRKVMDPVEEYERESRQAVAAEVGMAAQQRELVEFRLKDAVKEARKADAADREAAEQLVMDLQRELSESEVPVQPRLLVDDITPEKLASLLAAHDGRIAVVSAEGTAFEIMAGRYAASGGSNFEVFLKGHAGDAIRVDRVGREFEQVDHPALTMVLAVQPDVIRSCAANERFKGRGVLARFMYSIPRSPLGQRDVDPPPLHEETAQAYRTELRRLLEIELEVIDGDVRERELTLTTEAQAVRIDFAREVEPMLGTHGGLGSMSGWGGKLTGLVIRLAGLLHLAERTGDHRPWEAPVSADTLARAVEIGRYLIPHAKAAYAEMGASGAADDARHVLQWIERSETVSFSARDCFNVVRGRFGRMDRLWPALQLLEEYGYLRKKAEPPRQKRGQKPSPSFEVNPVVFAVAPDLSAHCADIAVPSPTGADSQADPSAPADIAVVSADDHPDMEVIDL